MLAVDAARLDAELVDRGWLVVDTAEDGDPLLSAVEVAAELDVTVKTSRLWMSEGRVPSVHWADRARILATLVNTLESSDQHLGLMTMCEGGGMANATLVERL